MDEDSALTAKRKRLAFRSWHRGTREADLLIGNFADRHLPAFDAGELEEFERLLELPDPDLYDWIAGRAVPFPDGPVPEGPVAARLRAFRLA